MAPPTKEEIIKYLENNNIAVPVGATYAELSAIYKELKTINLPVDSGASKPKAPAPPPNTGTIPKKQPHPKADSAPEQKGNTSESEKAPNDDELIAQLEKLKQILSLQKEISELQPKYIDSTPKGINYEDVRHMPPFNGTNSYRVERWLADYENLIATLNGNDRDKLRLVRRFLEGSAKKAVQYKPYAIWADLKKDLLSSFETKIFKSDVYKKLDRRVKNKEETIEEYIINMQEIAYLGEIPEDELIPYIVRGLRDHRCAFMLYGASDIPSLRKLLPMYEQAKSQFEWLNKRQNIPLRQGNVPKKDITCFKCAEKGHLANECTKKTPSLCFQCKQPGHVVSQCPVNKRTAVVIPENVTDNLMSELTAMDEQLGNDVDEVNAIQEVGLTLIRDKKIQFLFKNTNALFDTGSPVNFVGKSLIPKDFPLLQPQQTKYTGLGKTPLFSYGILNFIIKYKGKMHCQKIYVVSDSLLPTNLLLGRNFMKMFGIKLDQVDPSKNTILINKEFLKLLVNKFVTENSVKQNIVHQINNNLVVTQPINNQYNNESENLHCTMPDLIETTSNINDTFNYELTAFNINNNSEMELDIGFEFGSQIRSNCLEIITEYLDNNNEPLIFSDKYEMTLELTHNTPFFCAPRRLSYHEHDEVNKTISELLKSGIIRPSSSPYASPIVLVKKKPET